MIYAIARDIQTKNWYLVSITEPDARDRRHFIHTPADIRDIRAVVAARGGLSGQMQYAGRRQFQLLKPLQEQP